MNTMTTDRKHNHYFKDVSKLDTVDVYRVLHLFNVTDPCLQHAVKKLLVAGGRGAGKDISRDIKEAVDSLQRWQEMREEEAPTTIRMKLPDIVPSELIRQDSAPQMGQVTRFNLADKRNAHTTYYNPSDTQAMKVQIGSKLGRFTPVVNGVCLCAEPCAGYTFEVPPRGSYMAAGEGAVMFLEWREHLRPFEPSRDSLQP